MQQTDKPACRFFLKPDGCKNGDDCQYAHPRTNGKCLRCGSEARNLQKLHSPSPDNKPHDLASPSLRPRRNLPRLRRQKPRRRKSLHHLTVRVGAKESPKGRAIRRSLPPRLEKLTLTMLSKKRVRKRNLKNGQKIRKIQKFILLMPRLPIAKRILVACPTSLQAKARMCIFYCSTSAQRSRTSS